MNTRLTTSKVFFDVDYFTGLTSHIEQFRVGSLLEHRQRHRVLYFDARAGSEDGIGDCLLRTAGAVSYEYDLIVIRGDTKDAAATAQKDQILRSLGRNVQIAVLGSSFNPRSRMPRLTPISGDRVVLPELSTLREIELTGLLMARRAILGIDDPSKHFQLTGGTHIDQYVRLRDVLIDAVDASRLADWVLPHVKNGVFLLGSNPGLLPLIQATQIAALKRFGWHIDGNVVGASPGTEGDFSANVAELAAAATRSNRPTTVLIGVDSGRKRWHECESMINMHDRVSLVEVGEDYDSESVSFVHLPATTWPNKKSACLRCRNGAELWSIDSSREDLLPPLKDSVRKFPTARVFSESRQKFWELVDKQHALRLHREIPYHDGHAHSSRHRGIDIDISKLLADEVFFERCVKALRSHMADSPDLVVLPKHEATDALWDLLSSAFGSEVTENIWITNGSALDEGLANKARDSQVRNIAIVDDAIVTGTTINRLFKALRQACGHRWSAKRISGFSVLSLVSSKQDLQHVRNQFKSHRESPGFVTAEELFIPEKCPWCEEETLVQSLLELESGISSRHRQILQSRLVDLSSNTEDSRLFAPWGSSLNTGCEPSQLCGTLIGDEVSAPTLFAAFACAVNEFRDGATASPNDRFIVAIKHLTTAFDGSVARAALLRTFEESELKATKQAKPFRDAWSQVIAKGMSDEELFEYGWAAHVDKFDPESSALIFQEIGSRSKTNDGPLSLLRDRLRVRQLSTE